jgi:DNA sulfur modification protein DndC
MQLDFHQSKAIDILLGLPASTKKYLSFSGGKDSTALLGLALLATQEGFSNWEVVHSNTLMEIPMMDAHIEECQKLCKERGIIFHYAIPDVESRFFYQLIGKGVPTPHRNFRWCTDKLKIKPIEKIVKASQEAYIGINGERLGESNNRDKKLKGQCDSTNECGITEQDKKKVFRHLCRPLLNFSTCQVWDTLAVLDLSEVLPDAFNRLEMIYSISEQNSGDSLRTGCIGCPLIKKDKSLERFVNVHPGYSPLTDLAAIYLSFREKSNRIMRPDGKLLGAVLLSHRKAMYERILDIEASVKQNHPNFTLIHPEEKLAINTALAKQRYPKGYSREYLKSVGAID